MLKVLNLATILYIFLIDNAHLSKAHGLVLRTWM